MRLSTLALAAIGTANVNIANAIAIDLGLNLGTAGAFTLTVNGDTWFTSHSPSLTLAGRQYSAADGSLKLVNTTNNLKGSDAVGQWTGTTIAWDAGGTPYETRYEEAMVGSSAEKSGVWLCGVFGSVRLTSLAVVTPSTPMLMPDRHIQIAMFTQNDAIV